MSKDSSGSPSMTRFVPFLSLTTDHFLVSEKDLVESLRTSPLAAHSIAFIAATQSQKYTIERDAISQFSLLTSSTAEKADASLSPGYRSKDRITVESDASSSADRQISIFGHPKRGTNPHHDSL